MLPTCLVDQATIEWRDGAPLSATYGDIYWARGSPFAEKRCVFIEPLLRLAGSPPAASRITVGELGFGFGVNCLLAADAWQAMPPTCRLNLIAIEGHPVSPVDLKRFHKPHGRRHAEALLAGYPPPYRGQHVIWLADNIRLLLIFDDVESALANLDARVDCWFLDGFAPSKNPAMWRPSVFAKMFARSNRGAAVATYTAAGEVRRGLDAAGFATRREQGFGDKKEMLRAHKPGSWRISRRPAPSVAIVGAGIAGVYCAEALQKRALPYRLLDAGEPGPSAVPQLAVTPQLATQPELKHRFSLCASQYMRTSPGFHATGVLRYGRDSDEADRLARTAGLFPDYLLEARPPSAIRFHHGGWLCFEQLRAAIAPPVRQARVTGLHRSGGWSCFSGKTCVARADHIILAPGFSPALLPPQLEVRPLRGQAIRVGSNGIEQVINGRVTVFPTVKGRSLVSGTYGRGVATAADDHDTAELIRLGRQLATLDDRAPEAFVGIRAVSRDRLPIVGGMPDREALQKAARPAALSEPGLHLCTAFGSRGATHARLCAEHLVSRLLGEPAALGKAEQRMLAPARFALRDASRQTHGR